MHYNKHRLYSRGKKYHGGSIFTDAMKTIGKRGLNVLASAALPLIENKAKSFIRDKMRQILGSGLKKF